MTRPDGQVLLILDAPPGEGEDPIAHDISAAAIVGDTLFLAADECAHVERLDRLDAGSFGAHARTCLADRFDLPGGPDEMDIEGLAVEGGWLWIVGSHSLTRKKPKKGRPVDGRALERLAELKDNLNRMFVGRLPLRRREGELWEIDPDRPGQMLPIGKKGSRLVELMRDDPLLKPFLKLAAKENGVDVEGVVVDGERVALGMRGPVINGWACVLEVRLAAAGGGELAVEGGLRLRFLDLGGLGIRDMKRSDGDVYVLAGPTMALSGPSRLYRWSGWNDEDDDNRLHRPQLVRDLPHGQGRDHPEAVVRWDVGGAPGVMVVCDSPAPERLRDGGVVADAFCYPG